MAIEFLQDITAQDISAVDLTLSGNLTVNGTVTTVDSATLVVDDPLIKLAKDNAGDTVDVGFYGVMNDGTEKYIGLFRDATDAKFKLFHSLEVEPTTTVNTAGTGYAAGTLVANIEGNVTGNVTGNVNGVDPSAHASRHVGGGSDELDGDKLDVTFTPANYTPDATPAEADDVDDLAAHLKGIDTALGLAGGSIGTYTEAIGNGASTSFVVNHALSSQNVVVTIRKTGTPYTQVFAEVEATDANNVTVKFATAPSASQYTVTVVG